VYEGVVQDLIDELGRLPGVGPKGAQRIAFHLLIADPTDVRRLADALVQLKEQPKVSPVWLMRRVPKPVMVTTSSITPTPACTWPR
jgi:endonuclease III